MVVLVLGLVIFLTIHSLRIVAEPTRNRMLARLGENRFKGIYSVLSLVGIVLVVSGYRDVRMESALLYAPPEGLRHLALLLVPVGFVLVASAYLRGGRIKRAVRHPMVLGVGLWALGHVLANGTVADAVLFGSFLVWAVLDYASAINRAVPAPAGKSPSLTGDVLAVVIGLGLSALFILWAHRWLFGVAPIA
ncbi:NnrU family protein [Aurantimonas sp. A2-1-M11]|uniref:NnrU family protein n=1 Tax=Aurantimonas sp. A2-1-M11 TaxID=3113712 RepID=UPI002F935F43